MKTRQKNKVVVCYYGCTWRSICVCVQMLRNTCIICCIDMYKIQATNVPSNAHICITVSLLLVFVKHCARCVTRNVWLLHYALIQRILACIVYVVGILFFIVFTTRILQRNITPCNNNGCTFPTILIIQNFITKKKQQTISTN